VLVAMKNLGAVWLLVSLAACSSRPLTSTDGSPHPDGSPNPDGGAPPKADAQPDRSVQPDASAHPDASVQPGADAHPEASGPPEIVKDVSQSLNRDMDILFMVDNSFGMSPLQHKLTASFSTFVDVLSQLPGGLPNLHLAVVSSDMGAGTDLASQIPGCRLGGDGGTFQSMPRGTTCATGQLNAGQSFIIASNTPGTGNFTGNLADTFGCMATLGDGGCGFEHQLASVLRALGADGRGNPPVENANFLRPNATLAVVLFTNEDDCSAPPDSQLFDPSSAHVSDPLGPLASYRCNEFGHLCGGARPPRMPSGSTDLSGTCVSAEDGVLFKVADVVTKLRQLKNDPTKVLVAAIAAPVMPYVVRLAAPINDDTAQWPYVDHSCVAKDQTSGDPAVRIKQWVDAFGDNGVFQEICNDTFAPALQTIAKRIGAALGPLCIEGKLLDADPATPGVQPDCAFVDHTFNDQGVRIDVPLPACAPNGNTIPCWTFASSSTQCAAGKQVDFRRPPGPPVSDLSTTATCQACAPNDLRPGCLSQ
jgi:hypothetical protein